VVIGTFAGFAIGGGCCRRSRRSIASVLVAGVLLGLQSADAVLLLDDDRLEFADFVLDGAQVLFLLISSNGLVGKPFLQCMWYSPTKPLPAVRHR